MFRVAYKPSVEKDLRSLPKNQISNLLKKAQMLATDPLPYNSVKLSGTDNLYRVRSGDYRIVYSVNRDLKEVVVHHIRHRRDVYRGL